MTYPVEVDVGIEDGLQQGYYTSSWIDEEEIIVEDIVDEVCHSVFWGLQILYN